MQPLSHPRIPEGIPALAAEGREFVPPASRGCATPHAQRPAFIHPGVQLYPCEEDAAAHLLGAGARIAERRRSRDTQVSHP